MLTLTPRTEPPLVGRHGEKRRVDELVGAARAGRGGSLVLSCEAGIGKSTLLAHAVQTASGFRVLRASGAEFEQELPYSALHQLCAPILEYLTELPDRRRDALRVAFGLADGTPSRGSRRVGRGHRPAHGPGPAGMAPRTDQRRPG